MLKFVLILAILSILFLLWICAIRPNRITEERRGKIRPFEERYIAHRGLFQNKRKRTGEPPIAPENSLEAFRLAADRGYGMEMDVQLTKDDQLVVFHDGDLSRMCGDHRRVCECNYAEIRSLPLKGSAQYIPLFREVRDLVAGRVPLLIEIKPDGDCKRTARVLNELLKDYKGVYCIESFDPRAIHWYRKNRPDIIRGQLSERFGRTGIIHHDLVRKLCGALLFNFYGKPDFISYNHKHKNQLSYRLLRKIYPVYNAAWTIRSQEQLEKAKDVFSIFIFDSFIPDMPE